MGCVLFHLLSVLSLLACSDHEFSPLDDPNDLGPVTPVPEPDPEVPTPVPDPEPVPTTPDIEVTPLVLDFGAHPAGEIQLAHFTVSNLGDGDLDVTDIEIVGTTAFALATNSAFVLEPAESMTVEVTYLPGSGQSLATAEVHSDDPDEARVDVSLRGTATVPDLVVTPTGHDFGSIEATCVVSQPITLSNVGGDVLTVSAIEFDDTDATMTLVQPHALPLSLIPGQSVDVEVFFAPLAPTLTPRGTLRVVSDDPDGDVSATQLGTAFESTAYDTFTVPPDPPLDIVFVVDQSGSMDNRNADMADALDDFVLALGTVTADWRIGVVTYDDGCLNTWFDASDPDPFDAFHDAVLLGYQDGPDNVDTERLFTLAGRALVNTGAGGCNEVFRRPNGFLHVIMISDENEQSHDPNNLRPPYDAVSGAVGVYQNYVTTPGMLTVSAVANITNDCQTQGDAIAQGGDRYIAMAAAAGGVALDICDDAWGPQMAALGASLPTEHTFPLSEASVASTVAVTLDGGPFADWTLDPVGNTVTVTSATSPLPPGGLIEVAYVVPAVCP